MTNVKSRQYTLATFYEPGSFMSEETSRVVKTRDPNEIAKMAPERAFCFTIEDFVEKTTTVDGENFKKTESVGGPSGRFYLGGNLYTVDELKAKFEGDRNKQTLISNIEGNGYPKAIHCRTGNWQPFTDQDVFLDIAA